MGFAFGRLILAILLWVSVSSIQSVLGESITVSCSPQTICAMREAEVELKCFHSNITPVFWFSPKQKAKWRSEDHPEDLASDSDYAGRVRTKTTSSSSTLTISDLGERDSGEYHLLIITEKGKNHLSSAAVTVNVADVQLRMNQSGQIVALTCSTSCSLTRAPDYYLWYKDTVYMEKYTPYKIPKPLVLSSRADSGSYSCSVSSVSSLKSPAVDVFKEDSLDVIYTEREICALQGLPVDFPCTYARPKGERVNEAFWFYFRPEVEPEELSLEEQFTGRVQYVGDKERECTLRMTDVGERDSGEYRFQFSTQSGEKFTASPGVTLKVTALQVRVSPSTASDGETVTLMCSSTCTLPNNPTYIWYKNTQPVTNKHTRDNKLQLKCSEDAGSYSCAVRGHEELQSRALTLSEKCAEGPEESSVLKPLTMGVLVCLAVILITAAVCVWWRKRSSVKGHSSNEESGQAMTSDPSQKAASGDEDGVQYCSVQFTLQKTHTGAPSPNTSHPLHTTEGDSVVYTTVNFRE